MAVLWFVRADAMYGFPAYQFPVLDIVRELGGESCFKFVCRLDQAPERARGHNSEHVATYDRVLLELATEEARSVRWRSGFYQVQDWRIASNIAKLPNYLAANPDHPSD